MLINVNQGSQNPGRARYLGYSASIEYLNTVHFNMRVGMPFKYEVWLGPKIKYEV